MKKNYNLHKIIIATIFFANLAVILAFWWSNSGPFIGTGEFAFVCIALGRLVGLLGGFFILVQLVLMGRIRYVEQVFGLDKQNNLHRKIGYTWGILIPLHPLLLTIGYAISSEVSLVAQFVDFLLNWQYVLRAVLGLVLLATIIIISISIIRKKLKYETWYFTHVFVYVAIFLIFSHQVQAGDMTDRRFYYYWFILNFTIFGLVLIYRFVRPLYLFWRHQFFVEKIVRENNSVVSVYISGKGIERFIFQAGQYAHITFLAKGKWYTHPFSFSAAPNGKTIRLSIKRSGDFTSQIEQIKIATKIIIDGPFGIFTEAMSKTNKFLFIAGGIGITPIYSLIESLSPRKIDMILVYSNRNRDDATFADELHQYQVKVHHVFTQEEVRGFEQGRIDKEKIVRLVPDFKERDIYICGPVPMMDGLVELFSELGVPRNQIHFERFGY